MIHINLLPAEYRRKARTPLKLMVGMSLAVAVNTSLLAYWTWTSFGVSAGIDSERSVLQLEIEGLEPQVAYHRSLEGESKAHKSREDTLAGITASRISWTEKLDQLIDVVNRGGDGQSHLIWLSDLSVAQQTSGQRLRPGQRASGGTLRGAGLSGSREFAQVANFLEDLERSPFISDFHPPAPPEGSESMQDATLDPSTVWSFPMALELKAPETRR
jgi:Tfp pilus assembly protein PilN